jgi:hypothetical protein
VNRVFCSKVCVVEFVEAQAANIAFSHESANFGCLFLAAFYSGKVPVGKEKENLVGSPSVPLFIPAREFAHEASFN